MPEPDLSIPVWRACLAIALAMAVGLILMPVFTLLPRLLFWGGPIGPAFALFVAPLIGLFVGPFIAPMSVLLATLALATVVFGFTGLGRTKPVAKRIWLWALAGVIVGAATGTALALEIVTFGFELPGTAISGGATGLVCALVARRVMAFQP